MIACRKYLIEAGCDPTTPGHIVGSSFVGVEELNPMYFAFDLGYPVRLLVS